MARESGWLVAACVFGCAVIIVVIGYWSTLESLVWVWSHDGTYQYAFFIFPLSIWIAITLRHKLLAIPPRPSIWGLPLVAGLVFVWFIGHRLDINLAQHFALVALFPALVLAIWGLRAAWVLVFPLGYLVFAVPWGDSLVGPLQDFTAHFAVRALELTGTPVLLNGREIVTPAAVWMVADACSGIKFFIACTALGCLYAYLMYLHWWKRVLFVALAAVVPIIANGFRVYFTVLIGDIWGVQYATGTDHLIFGWQFFGTVLLILLGVGWLFRDAYASTPSAPHRGAGFSTTRAVVWVLALVLVVSGPVLAAWMKSPSTSGGRLNLVAPAVQGWLGPQTAQTNWKPLYKGADSEMRVAYQAESENASVELFHAIYLGPPRRGHDLITYGNSVTNPATDRVLSTATRHIVLSNGRTISAKELRLAAGGGERLIWYWYCVDGHYTDSAVLVKLIQTWDALVGQVSQSSVWAVSAADTHGNSGGLRAKLAAFVRTVPGVGRKPSAGTANTADAASQP
ncbi:MAG: exosortase A [Gammaproteobacteria bacterium]